MKRYNLDQTWELCLKMWKRIAKEWTEGIAVDGLKHEWLENHRIGSINSDCFFCGYSMQHGARCDCCPGVKVDPDFDCMDEPDYAIDPVEFYKLLLTLNKKRLSKKRK